MPHVNQESRHVVLITDLLGSPVTGLAAGDFTISLKRESGDALVAASETVAVTAIGAGLYWFDWTPAQLGLYRCTISHATYTVTPATIEEVVESGYSATTGPYLTTRANVKTALSIAMASWDAIIDQLLAQVTEAIQSECARVFAYDAAIVEYPSVLGWPISRVFLERPPVASVATVHASFDVPRVYDATTLLDTDEYVAALDDNDSGIVQFVSPFATTGPTLRSIRVAYAGGFTTIPADVERAAIEVISVKLHKGKENLYHISTRDIGDGRFAILTRDDLEPARQVIERYRRFPHG